MIYSEKLLQTIIQVFLYLNEMDSPFSSSDLELAQLALKFCVK